MNVAFLILRIILIFDVGFLAGAAWGAVMGERRCDSCGTNLRSERDGSHVPVPVG